MLKAKAYIVVGATAFFFMWTTPEAYPDTYYFYASSRQTWDRTGNWYLDEAHTTPAGQQPSDTDDVIFVSNITGLGGTNRTTNTLSSTLSM